MEKPRIPNNKNKRNDDPEKYNTIDNLDEYFKSVVAADTYRIMGLNGFGG